MKISEYLASQGYWCNFTSDPQKIGAASQVYRKGNIEFHQPSEDEEEYIFSAKGRNDIFSITDIETVKTLIYIHSNNWTYKPSLAVRIKEKELEYRVRHFSRMLDLQIVRLTFGHLSRTVLQNLNTYENQ